MPGGMEVLTKVQRHLLGSFFNRGGWVLDFSNSTMADFTVESIGVDVQSTYGGSKGASLQSFFLKGDEVAVITLARDLVEYMETVLSNDEMYVGDEAKQLEKIKQIIIQPVNSTQSRLEKIDFSDLNNDAYLDELLMELTNRIDTNPATVIGQAKDLLEAVYKRILEHYDIPFDKNSNMTKLLNQVNEALGLVPNEQNKETDIGAVSAKILGSLNQVANGLNELRNQFGRGHGRGSTQAGAIHVPSRYANLAVATTSALVTFLVQTVKKVDQFK